MREDPLKYPLTLLQDHVKRYSLPKEHKFYKWVMKRLAALKEWILKQ